MNKWIINCILILAIFMPCMPKLLIANGITMYPFEIISFLCFPLLFKFIRTKIQKVLFGLWIIILISTIGSFMFNIDIGGLMRCLKEIIYIPLLYIAYKKEWLSYKHLTYIFITAALINVIFLFTNGLDLNNLNIWDSSKMASGLSNRCFNFSTMTIEKLPSHSHGIWGNYCALSLCNSFLAYNNSSISKKILYITIVLVLINLGLSVSRESLICIGSVFLGYSISTFYINGKFKLNYRIIFSGIIILILVFTIIIQFSENLLIVQKIIYTMESFSENGEESNIMLRLGAWNVFGESLWRYPFFILLGYGYNLTNYSSFIEFAKYNHNYEYVELPESFFIETICFGGIIALWLGIKFWRYIFIYINKVNKINNRIIIKGFFLGLLFVNTFSGASIISDLLYAQVLILIGILMKDYNSKIKICKKI